VIDAMPNLASLKMWYFLSRPIIFYLAPFGAESGLCFKALSASCPARPHRARTVCLAYSLYLGTRPRSGIEGPTGLRLCVALSAEEHAGNDPDAEGDAHN
jgi:hypothetical protein